MGGNGFPVSDFGNPCSLMRLISSSEVKTASSKKKLRFGSSALTQINKSLFFYLAKSS